MPEYRIEIRKSAAKEIRAISRKGDRERVLERIDALAANPRPPGCTKLSGRDSYRVRQGVYRIIYTVADDVLLVEVVKVGHHKNVYD